MTNAPTPIIDIADPGLWPWIAWACIAVSVVAWLALIWKCHVRQHRFRVIAQPLITGFLMNVLAIGLTIGIEHQQTQNPTLRALQTGSLIKALRDNQVTIDMRDQVAFSFHDGTRQLTVASTPSMAKAILHQAAHERSIDKRQ